MKPSALLLTLVVLFSAVVTLTPVGAAQRCVIMEDFTNASCPPCAAVNPTLRAMTSSMTHDSLVVVAYHVSWPGYDPMYNYNTSEVNSRVGYYNVTGVPHVMVDGTWGITPGVSNVNTTIRNYIRSRYAVESPCTIEFSAVAVGETSVQVIGTVTAEQDMLSSSLRLFAALIVDTIQYSSPPGSNGETLFPDVFRDMWPSASGQAFTLSAGQTYDFSGMLNRDASWILDDLEVVVWAQDYSTHAVHQAGIARITRDYAFETGSSSPRQLVRNPNGGEVTYQVDLSNVGDLDDTYDVDLEGTFPAGWTHSVEAAGVPADPVHIQVPVASGEQTQITVHLNPSGVSGSVEFGVQVTTPNEPLLSSAESFRLMSGLDILLVDDDGGGNRETWYLDALAATQPNRLYGRWDLYESGLTASDLDGVDLIIWFTGDTWLDGTTLTPADQTLLGGYLDQGGALFLSGQGIGGDIGGDPFFANYIHGIYRQNYPGNYHLSPMPGDPIGNGLSPTISGGDGANNQTRQSSSDPDASGFATPILNWSTPPELGGYPAHKVDAGTYRIVYLGFGFEALNSSGMRNVVMERSINWLLPDLPLPAPENVTISVSGNNITLRWNEVVDAAGYSVYWCSTPDGVYWEDESGLYDGTSWTAPLSQTKRYYYVIAWP